MYIKYQGFVVRELVPVIFAKTRLPRDKKSPTSRLLMGLHMSASTTLCSRLLASLLHHHHLLLPLHPNSYCRHLGNHHHRVFTSAFSSTCALNMPVGSPKRRRSADGSAAPPAKRKVQSTTTRKVPHHVLYISALLAH